MPEPHPTVTLYDGREVSSWSQEWLAETRERHQLMIEVFRLHDREERRGRIAKYEARVIRLATEAGSATPVAVGAEARRRLEAVIMERWRKQQAESAA